MSTTVDAGQDVQSGSKELVGYVEAVTENAALGWVWCPGAPGRIRVELRLEGQAISTSIADEMREDLKRNGVGDGCHAFRLAIGEEFRSQVQELRVFAFNADGDAIQLGAPKLADGLSHREQSRLERGIEALINSQRLIHRNLQAALLQRDTAVSASMAEFATVQTSLKESIAVVELFVTRLEQALPTAGSVTSQPTGNRILPMVITISTMALIVSSLALLRSVMSN